MSAFSWLGRRFPLLGETRKGICMLDKKAKEKIIKKFKTHAQDTGSTQIQVAILTEEVKQLTDHLKKHKKDFSSRRGLLKKVAERRRLLIYLKREEPESYEKLMKELKLKVGQLLDEEERKAQADEVEIAPKTESETPEAVEEPKDVKKSEG